MDSKTEKRYPQCRIIKKNTEALIDEWEKLQQKNSYDDIADITKSVARYLHFGAKSAAAISSSLLLVESGFAFLNTNNPLARFNIGTWANRIAFGLSAFAAAQSSEQFLHLYFREGNSRRTTKAKLNAVSNLMFTAGLIFSAEAVLGLSNCLYFPVVGAYMFVGGLVLILAVSQFDTIYELLHFPTEVAFKKLWEKFEESKEYPIYSDLLYGAKTNTVKAIKSIIRLSESPFLFGSC